MAFEPKKFNDIIEDMRTRNAQLTDFEVGSVSRTLMESFSYEMAVLYEKMNQIYLSAYIDTATGFQLDQVVAILGIKRSLPDFSVGSVIFERDIGNEDIIIPIGTTVATEDSPENPKKVYHSIEQGTLASNESTVSIKVQAIKAGENQDAAIGTVVVMPKPVPGVKAVNNEEVIRLIGRRRETDEELRERAKNTLIASGKANILSIENAVLSLRRVLDVKVKERFHFAEGLLTFSRIDTTQKAYIPKGSEISTTDSDGQKWFYRLVEDVPFPIGENQSSGTVRALKEGNASELAPVAIMNIEDSQLATGFSIAGHGAIERGAYGIFEVFVDALELDAPYEPGQLPTLRSVIAEEIEAVRAAGIFVKLKEAKKIEVDAVIRIQISAALNLNEEERKNFELEVQHQVHDYFLSLKLGETFAFSQMIKSVISLESVENLEDFWLQTIIQNAGSPFTIEYEFSNNKITAEDNERFSPRHICIASEEKDLPIHLEFQATGINGQVDAFQENMLVYFNSKSLGEEIPIDELRTEVNDQLTSLGATLVAGSFKARPESWCDRPTLITEAGEEIIKTSFVEKPILGTQLFAYENQLLIDGAVQLQFNTPLTQLQKLAVYQKVEEIIIEFFDELTMEEDALFTKMIQRIETVLEVRRASATSTDFQALLTDVVQPDRVSDESIGVEPFEKIFKRNMLLSDSTELVTIRVLALAVKLTPESADTQETETNELRALLGHTINNFFNDFAAGDDVVFDNFSIALGNAAPGLNYEITALEMAARSVDGRIQNADLLDPNDIGIRSIELASIQTFNPNDDSILQITISS